MAIYQTQTYTTNEKHEIFKKKLLDLKKKEDISRLIENSFSYHLPRNLILLF